MQVDKHFSDIVEDQFDFHSYCMRKMTLRSYIALLRTEDTIYRHKFFVRAAFAIITVTTPAQKRVYYKTRLFIKVLFHALTVLKDILTYMMLAWKFTTHSDHTDHCVW